MGMNWNDLGGQLLGAGAPLLGSLLGGLLPIPGASMLGQAAGELIAKSLGVAPQPELVHKALAESDPSVAAEKIKLAEIEAAARWPALAEMAKAKMEADTAQYRASLDDLKDARAQTIGLVREKSSIAWGAPVISTLIIAGFIFCIYELFHMAADVPPNVEKLLDGLFGSLTVLATMVGNYWLGSSAGSRSKDDAFADVVTQANSLASVAVKQAGAK